MRKIPSSIPELDFKSTYVSGLDPSHQLLYHIAVLVSTEEEPKADEVQFWLDAPSDELLYEVAARFLEEEWDDKMNAIVPPATLL